MSRLNEELEVKSNECLTLQSKILELNEEMNKLQEDHRVTITQLNQSLKETEDMKCSLEKTSKQNVQIGRPLSP